MKKSRSSKPKVTSGAALREKSRPLLTVPATGNTYRVRMPDIEDVIKTGVMPENFTAKTLEAIGKQSSRELIDQDLLDLEGVKRAAVTAALLEPRVVENPQSDDGVEYKDIPPEDRDYIHRWATRQLPDMSIPLSGGGKTSVDALEHFSSEEQSGESSSLGAHGANAGASGVATSGAG